MKIIVLILCILIVSVTSARGQWESVSFPIVIGDVTDTLVNSIYASGRTLFTRGQNKADYYNSKGFLWRSTDNGNTWVIDTSIGFPLITCFASQGTNMFLGAQTSSYNSNILNCGGIYYSNNEGLTWQLRNSGIKDSSLGNEVFSVAC